jgi:hypothetical protein
MAFFVPTSFPFVMSIVPKNVPPAHANPNNDIIMEPVHNDNGSDVDVTQAEVLNEDSYNSDNNRKMPACKNNDDEDANNEWQEDASTQK